MLTLLVVCRLERRLLQLMVSRELVEDGLDMLGEQKEEEVGREEVEVLMQESQDHKVVLKFEFRLTSLIV